MPTQPPFWLRVFFGLMAMGGCFIAGGGYATRGRVWIVPLLFAIYFLWMRVDLAHQEGMADWAAVQTDIAPGSYKVIYTMLCLDGVVEVVIRHDDDRGWLYSDQPVHYWYRSYRLPARGIENIRAGDHLVVEGKTPYKTLSVSRHAQVAC